ncbi:MULTISPECIES: PEP/pyruvate-binding domain-containing protein [Paenibacillus]|uniref:PEP/pyruvate-binding domain-containing protein n=1 Tax=Paenibacillus TaxID=44249 RepID=UPI002FDFCC13
MIIGFAEMNPELWPVAGGKGAMLSRMFCAGYPVPEGFIVMPSAFEQGRLTEEAWSKIRSRLNHLRKTHKNRSFAVRSSALAEDSEEASFAGEFGTVLNRKSDEEILEAIYEVHHSMEEERVRMYSSAKGVDFTRQIAIVVQIMIESEISGVLFTVDPITGGKLMQGNLVYGLGEQLVSGESNAEAFSFIRPKGKYSGPAAFKRYAGRLYNYAARLEKEFGSPQDIEWAVADGKLNILQSRPITTLSAGNRDTYEINDSLTGDFLWTNTNVGESMSNVMTPLSWSILRLLDEEHSLIPGEYMISGNICGRVYSNISYPLSMFAAFGVNPSTILRKMSRVFGQIPEGIEVPLIPFSRRELLGKIRAKFFYNVKQTQKAVKNAPRFLEETPEWCRTITERIRQTETREQLLDLWKREIWPHNVSAMWHALEAPSQAMQKFEKLHFKLSKRVGAEEANQLLSFGDAAELESLGPLLGISKVMRGELTEEKYIEKYGHRGPHEFELSIPGPGEDPVWLERQMSEYSAGSTNVNDLLRHRQVQNEAAWDRFRRIDPQAAKKTIRKLPLVSEGPRLREAVRSEWTRTYRVNRAFALKAGEFLGIEDNVFFLYMHELLAWLSGEETSAAGHLPARKQTYLRYQTLPAFPSMIRGRFDPFAWAEEPVRRTDVFDASLPLTNVETDSLRGVAGAAGRIKGVVRVLGHPEEGNQLLPGEILVASTINIGWTLLFPKVSAIITDIGAPLSHAAIVARELGIPAVVGCGNATSLLKTGDRVIVDGGQGIVQILSE